LLGIVVRYDIYFFKAWKWSGVECWKFLEISGPFVFSLVESRTKVGLADYRTRKSYCGLKSQILCSPPLGLKPHLNQSSSVRSSLSCHFFHAIFILLGLDVYHPSKSQKPSQ